MMQENDLVHQSERPVVKLSERPVVKLIANPSIVRLHVSSHKLSRCCITQKPMATRLLKLPQHRTIP